MSQVYPWPSLRLLLCHRGTQPLDKPPHQIGRWEKQQVGPAHSEVTLRGEKATPKVQEQE